MALTDICTDHGSCSRVHAALTYHKHLNRFFLTDLGSSKMMMLSIITVTIVVCFKFSSWFVYWKRPN